MPVVPQAAPPTAASHRPAKARAGRLKKFKREQAIVDLLNRGVSVAEIAAKVGVGEKRMRAIIREILARRMPEPPEAFVAIQVSRLNEALLVAFGAMTGANLGAVDRVVRIVRELDRYHGFQPAVGRRPRLEPVAERAIAFGAEPGDRPAIPLQDFGKIDSALGVLALAAASDAEPARSRAPAEPVPAVSPPCAEPDSRPEIFRHKTLERLIPRPES